MPLFFIPLKALSSNYISFFSSFGRWGVKGEDHDDKLFESFVNEWKLWHQRYALLFKKERTTVRTDLKAVIFLDVEVNNCIHDA